MEKALTQRQPRPRPGSVEPRQHQAGEGADRPSRQPLQGQVEAGEPPRQGDDRQIRDWAAF